MPPNGNAPDVLLSELTDADMVELVDLFVEELPDKIAAIRKAVEDQNLVAVATLAHQLKGSAGGYGFPTITTAATLVEASAKGEEKAEAIADQVNALSQLCGRARGTAT